MNIVWLSNSENLTCIYYFTIYIPFAKFVNCPKVVLPTVGNFVVQHLKMCILRTRGIRDTKTKFQAGGKKLKVVARREQITQGISNMESSQT